MTKFFSRKFLVWFVWLVFTGIACINSELPKEKIFETFGVVSMIYIGANTIQDFSPKKIEEKKEEDYKEDSGVSINE